MEQTQSRKIRCFRLILTLTILTNLGCKHEETNPELLDPIFKFMVDQSSQLKSRIETGTKKVEELEKALAKTSPLTAERKIAQRDLTQERERLALLQQEQTYVEIRTERRRVEARRAYKIAFMKDQPWPDPKEFEYFLTNYRLKTASRHWEARIPKLQDRLPSSKPGKDKKQAAKEAEE